MGLFITAVILLIALRLFAAWYNSPQKVGERGERRVAQTLRNGLTNEYCVLNDIYLPLPDGTTTQIDHIVVSRYGIFVVETKTYSGWIFGDKNSPQWTQTIFRKKSRFQNPLRQNFRHKCALADCLGISRDWFMDMVVFNGDCKFKTEMPPEIMHRRDAVRYIRNYTNPILKAKEVSDISSAIVEWTSSVGYVSRKNHVANLHKRHSAVSVSDGVQLCQFCEKSMVQSSGRERRVTLQEDVLAANNPSSELERRRKEQGTLQRRDHLPRTQRHRHRQGTVQLRKLRSQRRPCGGGDA